MAKTDWENMKVYFIFPNNPREYDADNEEDLREAKAIARARKPFVFYRDEVKLNKN